MNIDLLIAVPTSGLVHSSFAYSLAQLCSYLAQGKIPTVPEAKVASSCQMMVSSNWIENRERLAKTAVEKGYTHMMFLDDDMTFQPKVVDHLLGRRQKIVTTNYLIKTKRPDFVAVSHDMKRIRTTADSTGIEPVLYSGFGVSIIEVDVFKNIPQPWFVPDFLGNDDLYTTEDLPFFKRAAKAGYTCYVDHDASKLISHTGRFDWCWNEWSEGPKEAA